MGGAAILVAGTILRHVGDGLDAGLRRPTCLLQLGKHGWDIHDVAEGQHLLARQARGHQVVAVVDRQDVGIVLCHYLYPRIRQNTSKVKSE